jgi:hypothetical protein
VDNNSDGAVHYVISFLFLESAVLDTNIFLKVYVKIIFGTTEVLMDK